MPSFASAPVNYQRQDSHPDALLRDIDYAVDVGLNYIRWIEGALDRRTPDRLSVVRGLQLLEVGPGPTLGPALILACGGAQVTVVDRFAARWDRAYHPHVLRGIASRLELGGYSAAPIRRVLQTGSFDNDVIQVRECAAEDLAQLPAGAADLVISNAVLEHLSDVPRAVRGLAHVMKAGGLGLHQVDFRDHRDFSRPLEYLTLSDAEFGEIFTASNGECGNRWRPRMMADAFVEAGLTLRLLTPNMRADRAYVDEIKTRLHPDVLPLDDAELEATSAYLVVEKPATVHAGAQRT